MFDAPQRVSASSKKTKIQGDLDGFVVHVMPESFKQKKTVVKKEEDIKKTAKVLPPKSIVAAKPVAKAPVPLKKHSRQWILLGGALMIVLILGGAAIWMLFFTPPQDVAFPDESVVVVVQDPIVKQDEDIEIPAIRPGSDLDSDGLSDIEEALYGTDPRNPDTDGDTYLDGNEVFHGYSPLGKAPQTLLETGAVLQYVNAEHGFMLTYPRQWTIASEVNESFEQTAEIVFRTNSNATIRLAIIPFESEESFEAWYMRELLEVSEVEFQDLTNSLTKEGYVSYLSPDELLAYVIEQGYVYRFFYDLADEREIVYLQTFSMMINSFVLQ